MSHLSKHGIELLSRAIVPSLGEEQLHLLSNLFLIQMPAIFIINTGSCSRVWSTYGKKTQLLNKTFSKALKEWNCLLSLTLSYRKAMFLNLSHFKMSALQLPEFPSQVHLKVAKVKKLWCKVSISGEQFLVMTLHIHATQNWFAISFSRMSLKFPNYLWSSLVASYLS